MTQQSQAGRAQSCPSTSPARTPFLEEEIYDAAAESAAAEGKKVITGMLIVGLVFVAVIALGETTHWLRHRRRVRR